MRENSVRENSGGGPTAIPADEQQITGTERERGAERIYKVRESKEN